MAGRTYRYFAGKVAYPFGAGKSYAPVTYGDVSVAPVEGEPGRVEVRLSLKNEGTRPVDEVVPVYATPRPREPGDPLRFLAGVHREALAAGESKAVAFKVALTVLRRWRAVTAWDVVVGETLAVGVDLPANEAPPPTE
jgi:beta-glucosidase